MGWTNKTGSASRTDRIGKYNQLLRIEEFWEKLLAETKVCITYNMLNAVNKNLEKFVERFLRTKTSSLCFDIYSFYSCINICFGDHGLFQLYKLKKERILIQNHISQLRKEREELKKEKICLKII